MALNIRSHGLRERLIAEAQVGNMKPIFLTALGLTFMLATGCTVQNGPNPRAGGPGGPPGGPHGGPGHAPPQEAVDACNGLDEGASCSFDHDGRSMTGTCAAGPEGEAASCRPPRPDGPPPGGPPPGR